MENNHIIKKVYGWRVEDYDGYNDYYTNTNNKKGRWDMKK